MFKNGYILIFFFLLCVACEKEGLVKYSQDKDSIQFDYEIEDMVLDYNFALQYEERTVSDEWGSWKVNYYLGDSIWRDTISLALSLIGDSSEKDRIFRMKTVPIDGQDSVTMAKVEFLSSYVFRANQLVDTVQIILLRPTQRGEYKIGLTFDVEGDSNFNLGVKERTVYQLNIADRYEKPSDWDSQVMYIGEYSEEKYAFMVTTLHTLFSRWSDWGKNNLILREALEKYNQMHPDAPKDFDFPEL